MEEKVLNAALAGLLHDVGKIERDTKEDSSLSKLITLTSMLSAGERFEAKQPPAQLVSIFDRLIFGGYQPSENHFLPLASLSLDAIKRYIESDKLPDGNARNQSDELRLALENAVKQNNANGETNLENVLAAMQKYAWCMPSASIPDVSLYDHSRMTAALAVCMAEMPENQAGPVALLVGGDLSGVQELIYAISSKYAAKSLRGRSFYLQLLTEAILRFALSNLGLPYVNVIYSGGGHFYLLAPVSAREELAKVQKEISRILLKSHGTSLYLAIGCAEISASGFNVGNFSAYWKEMHKQVNLAKQSRYAELKDDLYQQVFSVPETGGNPDQTCSVCGEDVRQTSKLDELEAQDKVCSLCLSFAKQIGEELPDANFVALGFGGTATDKFDTAFDVLNAFGMQVKLIPSEKEKVQFNGADRIVIWALDDPKNGYPSCDQPVVHTLRYTVNQTPRDKKSEIVTFDKLQEESKGGFKRLGVLRMDVDNLGDVFSKGFRNEETQEDITALARVSALSSQVSLYFEGWVKRLCEKGERKGLVYAVYAGGDDVFLLGPWDQIPQLALDISEDFAKYVGKHQGLSISGGMAFVGGKYPIYQAAEDAGEAEGLAKNVGGKNAFAFLGVAWKWDEFRELQKKQERLVDMLTRENSEGSETPKSLLQIIRNLARMEENANKDQPTRPMWGAWMWLSAYQLKRAAERAEKKDKGLAQELLSLREDLAKNNYKELSQWGKAARWAQLIVRKPTKDN